MDEDGPLAGGPELYNAPGQTHRDVPISSRGQLVWYTVLGALLGFAVALVIWAATS